MKILRKTIVGILGCLMGLGLHAEPRPTKAYVTLGSNLPYEIFLNGTLVARGGYTGRDTVNKHPVPLKLIKEGENVLKFRLSSTGKKPGDYALLSYYFIVGYEEKKSKHIHSGLKGSTRVRNEKSEDWREPKLMPAFQTYRYSVIGPMIGRYRIPFVMLSEDGKLATGKESFICRHSFDLSDLKLTDVSAEHAVSTAQPTSWNGPGAYLVSEAMDGMSAGEYECAYQFAKRATEEDPEYDVGWYSLGMVAEMLDKMDEACKAYAKAAELNPEKLRSLMDSLREWGHCK